MALKRVLGDGGLSPPQRKRLRDLDMMHKADGSELHCSDLFQVAESCYEEEKRISLGENDTFPKVKDKQGQDIIRLIGHYLKTIGLTRSAELLTRESGCPLDHPAAVQFCDHVMQGKWVDAEEDLVKMKPLLRDSKASWREMKFLLLEQKYLELLDDGLVMDAMKVLREELTPLQHNVDRVHVLSTFIICSSMELRTRAMWAGKGDLSRSQLVEKVRECLPPTIMMPPGRLHDLLSQAVEHQKNQCLYHNTLLDGLNDVSLLEDHRCTTDQLPCETVQLLDDHSDEVWFCKFSPDGLKLATGSKDASVIVWDVNPDSLTCVRSKVLDDHPFGVATIAWSSDSNFVIACGREGSNEVWIWNLQGPEPTVSVFQAPDDSLTACAWYGDGKSFVVGGTRGRCYQCDQDGSVIDSREGVRVTCFWCQKDGVTMLASDTHHRIRNFRFDDIPDTLILNEDYPVMAFSVSTDDRLILLNIANQGIHLWDLQDRILLRKFQGALQGLFTINSCFGGINQDFVASGSEDGRVCIWNSKRDFPLATLIGHSGAVNCVSWNPVFYQMLASASDDRTVRIWGPASKWCTSSSDSLKSPANSSSKVMSANEVMSLSDINVQGWNFVTIQNLQNAVSEESETNENSPPEDSSALQPMDTSDPIILDEVCPDEKQVKSSVKQ